MCDFQTCQKFWKMFESWFEWCGNNCEVLEKASKIYNNRYIILAVDTFDLLLEAGMLKSNMLNLNEHQLH